MWTIGDALERSRGALLGVFHISHFEKARCGREEKGRGSGNTSQTLVYKVCFEAHQDFLFPSWSAVCISCNSIGALVAPDRPKFMKLPPLSRRVLLSLLTCLHTVINLKLSFGNHFQRAFQQQPHPFWLCICSKCSCRRSHLLVKVL